MYWSWTWIIATLFSFNWDIGIRSLQSFGMYRTFLNQIKDAQPFPMAITIMSLMSLTQRQWSLQQWWIKSWKRLTLVSHMLYCFNVGNFDEIKRSVTIIARNGVSIAWNTRKRIIRIKQKFVISGTTYTNFSMSLLFKGSLLMFFTMMMLWKRCFVHWIFIITIWTFIGKVAF